MAPLLQLVSLNKRSAMLLDRLMYNLKEIMKKPPVKDGSSDKESSVKFIYSEKAAKFCEIFPLLLTTVHTVKSRGKISQNFVPFSDIWTLNLTFHEDIITARPKASWIKKNQDQNYHSMKPYSLGEQQNLRSSFQSTIYLLKANLNVNLVCKARFTS